MPVWLNTTLLGFGTVFVGLICLIFITQLMGVVLRAFEKAPEQAPAPAAAAQPVKEDIPDRGAFVAAISAAIATVLGAEATGLRIHSIKKVN